MPCKGLLTRISVNTSVDPQATPTPRASPAASCCASSDADQSKACHGVQDSTWVRFLLTVVFVSPEEFEAVRAKQPELCEGYMVPVVASPLLTRVRYPTCDA
eukprot:2568612-Rhodomonas_salina.1